MATELDKALDRIMDALTAPGEMFETMPYERHGVEVPCFRNALPWLPAKLCRSDSALPRLGTQKIDKRSVKAAYLGEPATP